MKNTTSRFFLFFYNNFSKYCINFEDKKLEIKYKKMTHILWEERGVVRETICRGDRSMWARAF